jgi:hypothetical protein
LRSPIVHGMTVAPNTAVFNRSTIGTAESCVRLHADALEDGAAQMEPGAKRHLAAIPRIRPPTRPQLAAGLVRGRARRDQDLVHVVCPLPFLRTACAATVPDRPYTIPLAHQRTHLL